MKSIRFAMLLVCLGATWQATAANITFNTFVTGASINAVEGQHQTIGFTYAGDKFVGTVYLGATNNQLYSTDLTGGNVQLFGNPLPTTFQGEIVVAGSLGQGGFGAGTVYAGASSTIYKYADNGGVPTAFATGMIGNLRGLLFDPGSSFGGNLLAVTDAGNIYKVTNSGTATLLASTGEDTEGMDIIQSGPLAGELVTASENSGRLRVIDPNGTIHLATLSGAVTTIPAFETVNYVPLDIGLSGNPLEGYYAANFAQDIQKAGADQFRSQNLGGHLLATSEDTVNARVWDIVYAGTGFNFTVQQYTGTLPNQAEDGIFITTQRITDTSSSPEPGSVLLMGGGFMGLWAARRRRQKSV